LSKEFGAPVALHRADYELARDNLKEPMLAKSPVGRFVLASIQKSFEQDRIELFEPEVFLKEGDSLESFGIKATILELPGHTRGSIGILVDGSDGSDGSDLFVGDALMNLYYPSRSLLYGNRENMLKSAKRISEYASATIHFGHGKSLKNRKW